MTSQTIRLMQVDSTTPKGRIQYNQIKALLDERASEITQRITQASQLRVGSIRDGYKFKGGDPSKKENWEKVK